MPHIEIKLYPGYGREKLEKLTQDVAAAAAEDLGVPENVVSVAFEEVSPEEWNDKVFLPLIRDRRGLAKAPEYS